MARALLEARCQFVVPSRIADADTSARASPKIGPGPVARPATSLAQGTQLGLKAAGSRLPSGAGSHASARSQRRGYGMSVSNIGVDPAVGNAHRGFRGLSGTGTSPESQA